MRTKVFLLATAFMASVSALFAVDYPARMYLIGDATPNNWDLNYFHGHHLSRSIYMDRRTERWSNEIHSISIV